MSSKKKLVGEILVEKGLISSQQLEAALAEQERTKEFLGTILLRNGWVEEKDLLGALSKRFNLPLVDLKDRYIDWKIVKSFSPSLILDHHYFPLEKDDWSVTIAVTNPLDAWALKKAEEETQGLKLKLVLSSEADLKDAIERYRVYVQRNVPKLLE